ncbi:hypothetical protein [Sorangium sp. So ce1097]|uniref:hypothetical protein n=1 Tax=Sorangium sp. So ce1097 TaxID=3133330 RepID=UPI003F5E6109
MTDIIVIGAGKFALEVTAYIAEREGGAAARVRGYVALDDEEVRAQGAPVERLSEHAPRADAEYVLAVSAMERRVELISGLIDRHDLRLATVVHRSARINPEQRMGPGNIIGPKCYVGTNARLGRLNVLNAFCSLGHHATVGDNNFFSPNVHTGNSVQIGRDNLFGLGTVMIHELRIGDNNKVQAGTAIVEDVGDGQLVMMSSRVKQVGLYGRREENG